MKGVGVILLLGIFLGRGSAVFLNHRPFPTYSLEDMPRTQFSCREKILGGYYADPEAQCQMFHICVKVAGVGVQDFRFLCPNGTAFDQDHQICAEWEDVDCDATTLYYSSDNFDLYRVGSGYESKPFKYGEEEDVFALQRAETGDIRLNREHQVQSVNQQKDPYQRPAKNINFNNNRNNYNSNVNNNRNYNNKNDEDKEIFQKSSSSNFFNNRNNGKENDEDYDDNVNYNQNQDFEQKRKIVRKQQRRPVQQTTTTTTTTSTAAPIQQTRRPHQRPTGFVNNFAGSSYATSTKSSINSEQESTSNNNFNNFRRAGNNVQRRPTTSADNINNNFQQTNSQNNNQNFNSPTPAYTVSTPAPFSRQNIQTQNNYNKPTTFNGNHYTSNQFQSSTSRPSTENYPTPQSNYNANYDVSKSTKQQITENYPSNNPQYTKTPISSSSFNPPNYSAFDKKPTGINYKPTTFSPKAKPFSASNNQGQSNAFPTTFSPRVNQGYNQIAQQTQAFNNQNQNNFNNQGFTSTTQKTTAASFTQYTPTVPKISSTTPINRPIIKYDQSQYDDGSYDTKYDYNDNKDDEFLKTAHSQNIANSRNEYEKNLKQSNFDQRNGFGTSTENYPKNVSPTINYSKTPFQAQKNNQYTQNTPQPQRNTQKPSPQQRNAQYEQNTPQPQRNTQQPQRNTQFTQQNAQHQRNTQQTQQQNIQQPQTNTQNSQQIKTNSAPSQNQKRVVKKPKDYDYAYYDSAPADVDEYQIDADIKKERRN